MNFARHLAAALGLCLTLVAPFSPAGPVYPLKKRTDGRDLVDQNHVPCLLLGDSPQALMVNLSELDADAFFADRSGYGFNTMWVNLLCATYTGGRDDASTLDGLLPFVGKLSSNGPYDLTQPNETYFAHVDRILELAGQHGIQLLLDPAETGSFLSVMRANGTNRCRAYGQFLGKRYQAAPNLIWMSGNDFQTWRTAADDAVVRAVAQGIRDQDTNHLQTTELDYVVSSSLDDTNWNALLGLNGTYTYYPTYARLQQDYGRTNFLPDFLVEANYEFESLQGPVTTPAILRKQGYWTMTSGACGQLYGNHYTWPFADGWQGFLDTAGAAQMSYLQAFFDARAWYELVPDTNHSVVTAGYGTFAATGHVADNNYLTAARTPDGSLAVIYTPMIRQFTVDLSQLAGPVVTRWFDPSSGTYLKISDSPLSNNGTRNFTPPGNNSDGDGGWVLVLETNPPPETPPAPARPRFVQQVYATPQSPQDQVVVAYPQAQAAGNANILAIGWNDTVANITAVTDDLGNPYQVAVQTFRGDGLSQAIYYAGDIRAGTNRVTVYFDQPAVFLDLRALEYSGLARDNLLAGSASASGLGTSADSGALAVAGTNALLLGAGMTVTTFIAPGSGFTQRVITSPDADLVADRIATTAGDYRATAALSSGAWLMQLAAFNADNGTLRPSLRISLTETNTVVLAWPAASAGFHLEQNSTLAPTNWIPVTNVVTAVGTELQALLPRLPTNQYYRSSR